MTDMKDFDRAFAYDSVENLIAVPSHDFDSDQWIICALRRPRAFRNELSASVNGPQNVHGAAWASLVEVYR